MSPDRTRPIRILIVDDHAVVRMGLAALFGTVPHFAVVGEAATVAGALHEARRCRPDVVTMDVRLPDGNGVEACRDLRAERPETRVIVLTAFAHDDAVIDSIMAGAAGYLLKSADPEGLIAAIETVAAGGSLLDPSVVAAVLRRLRQAAAGPVDADPLAALSPHERKILPLIADGKTNREIAAELFVSEHTVKAHVSEILRKLRLSRRGQIAALVGRGLDNRAYSGVRAD